ncbi:MAG TPA: TonB dependent receptor [Candidatus Kapabacteria bacterium]|nr:TonB dependent receptor [Candidatus Kapabacteria bacterium]
MHKALPARARAVEQIAAVAVSTFASGPSLYLLHPDMKQPHHHPGFSSSHRRMQRCVLAVTAALLMPLLAHAQRSGVVEGVVRDSVTRAPLVGATVILRDAADTTSRALGDLTDAAGAFRIERVPIGRPMALEVTFVGYTKLERERVFLGESTTELRIDDVMLAPSSIGLKTVTVQGSRPDVVVLADKTVYSVENNPTYTATNVSELLGQIPSIDVDPDGKVSLRGDDNVTIMVNDRPLTMPVDQRNKFLQSLPASMIKDIEVRTSPGARYDAKNQAGIINIVTRRTMGDMLGGNVNAGVDSRGGGNGGAGLYFNGEQLTASLGGGLFGSRNTGESTTRRWNFLDSIEARLEGSGASESTSGSYHAYGQVDYKVTPQDLVSLSFSTNGWTSDYTSHTDNTFFGAGGAMVTRSADTSRPGSGAGNEGGYTSASALMKHTFEGDHAISLDVNYNANAYNGSNNYSSTYHRAGGELDSTRSSARRSAYDRTSTTIITALDYENPLSDALTLSGGAKNEINLLDNSTAIEVLDRVTQAYVLDTLQSNHYRPENSIYAGYIGASWRPIKELGIQAGLRLEHATVSAAYATGAPIIERTYTNLFPSGTVTYNLTEEHSLGVSYRRSVALPDIDALNPTRIRWSDLYEQSGNPDLEPEFTHHVELKYNTFWGMGNMVAFSPYYSTTAGNIETSQRLEDGITYSSSANFNGRYSLGAETSISMRPMSWLNFRVGGDVYQLVNRGSDIPGDRHSTAVGYDANVSLNADLLEGMTFSISGYSSVPAAVGGSSTSGFSYWSLSLRQRLLEKKLTISLRVNDPLNLQEWRNDYESDGFRTESRSKWSSRFVGLNVSYAFGTQPRMEQHKVEKSETKGSGGSSGASGGGGGGGGGGGQ